MSWVPIADPPPAVLHRARVACGWSRSGDVYRWHGEVDGVVWHLWLYRWRGGWCGSADRWE